MLWPIRPKRIARWPAAAFAISIGTMNGHTRLRPEVNPAQNSSTPVPTGVTGPRPVTTTRRRSLGSAHPELRRDHVDGRADGLDLLHLVLGDLDVPFLLEGEHGLHQVERVGVE